MAQITGAQNERVFTIQKWLGLNQNPDGDTKLKMGEAAVMRNWRITRDGNLQKRPGTREVLHLGESDREMVLAVWTGFVAEEEAVYAIVGYPREGDTPGAGRLYRCTDDDGWQGTLIGSFAGIDMEFPHMFGFGEKLYILTGEDYYEYDGNTLRSVVGYIPLVAVTIPPEGGGELLEQVNKLNGSRRAWLSPNGTGTKFLLPDTYPIQAVDYVKDLGTDTNVPTTEYTVNLAERSITFNTAPAESVDKYEVGWHVAESFRTDVTGKVRSELFNGSQDTRVFLYGDGTADAVYSDIDYSGTPRADYFPDMNQIRIGEANTPITALVRQYSRLIAFKTDSTWSIQFGQITTAEGNLIAGFYVTPVNKTIGHNSWLANVELVLNNPVCIMGSDLYEWFPNRGGNLTNDERQAKRISDRVYETLRSFDMESNDREGLRFVRTFDDNYHQEYYLFNSDAQALVWNYAADAWYCYDNFPMYNPFVYRGELYYGSTSGGIQHVSTEYKSDKIASELQQAIDCRWESGAMSFGMDYQRKYAAMIWIGIKPESRGEVLVTVQTDRSSEYQEKAVSSTIFGFDSVDFADWTFDVNRRPHIYRLKIKAKKFIFYKLILINNDGLFGIVGTDGIDFSRLNFNDLDLTVARNEIHGTSATITSADMRVRYTGYAK